MGTHMLIEVTASIGREVNLIGSVVCISSRRFRMSLYLPGLACRSWIILIASCCPCASIDQHVSLFDCSPSHRQAKEKQYGGDLQQGRDKTYHHFLPSTISLSDFPEESGPRLAPDRPLTSTRRRQQSAQI